MLERIRHLRWGSVMVGLFALMILITAVPVIADIGDPMILGQPNSANHRTTLSGAAADDAVLRVRNKATDGTGIQILVAKGQPPLKVNTSTRVRNLNADKLDGLSAGAFLRKKHYDADRDSVVDNAERLGGLGAGQYATKAYVATNTLWAVVNADGTLARGSNVVSTAKTVGGGYEVIFNRDVTGCAYAATAGNAGGGVPPARLTGVASRDFKANAVHVRMWDAAGVLQQNSAFHLVVSC